MPSKMKTCEEYRMALTDAAAAAVQLSPELRSHLDACASCRGAFIEERQLFAGIDTGLRTSANAEVPTSLLPRVRAKLNERDAPGRSWIPSVSALAVAATVVVFVLVRGHGRDIVDLNPQLSSVVHGVQPAETIPAAAAAVPIEKTSPVVRKKTAQVAKTLPVVRAEEVAVLIPAGQKQAIAALLGSVQYGKFDGEAVLAERPEKALQELQVAPLDVSPIELKPLADVSAASRSQNEKTRD
jgi:hypothetical protein